MLTFKDSTDQPDLILSQRGKQVGNEGDIGGVRVLAAVLKHLSCTLLVYFI